MKAEKFKNRMKAMLWKMEQFAETNMPSKGNTSDTCQQRAILNALAEVEQNINGVTEKDMKADEE